MTDERNPSNDVLDVIARAIHADDWAEWLMGFPLGWTDLEDSATP